MPDSSPSARRCTTADRAFTLVELLTVLAIVGVLSALLIGSGVRVREGAKVAQAKAELAALAAGLEAYRRQWGDYPWTGDGAELLQALVGRRGPRGAGGGGRSVIELQRFRTERGSDPFATAAARLVDPWGRPYRYAYRTSEAWAAPSFVLFSEGPDAVSAPLASAGWTASGAAENRDNVYAGE